MINNKFPVCLDDFAKGRWSIRRYIITLNFLKRFIPAGSTLLDLGTENGLGNFMKLNGYHIINTVGFDFDLHYSRFCIYNPDAVTAFEIFEHLVNPFEVLRALPGEKLIASVSLRLWFAKAFKNKTNSAGWHYHEFEQWQFDFLLEKAGWTIIAREKHTAPTFIPGFRSILRWFTPRIYLVYAERRR
jgi:hypothetical protein